MDDTEKKKFFVETTNRLLRKLKSLSKEKYSPMRLVISDIMRETGWSPIYCTRGFLRGVVSSTRGPK